MERAFTLTNGEKIEGTGVSVFDKKNKQITELPDGWSVEYQNDNSPVAQVVQENAKDLTVDITTEGDDVGVARITAIVKNEAGEQLMDQDGTPPVAVVTVINSAPNTATWTPGTVVPE